MGNSDRTYGDCPVKGIAYEEEKRNLLIAGTLYGTSVIWGIQIELMGIVL